MQDEKASIESIRHAIINYIITDHPSTYSAATLPLDQSLVELVVGTFMTYPLEYQKSPAT